jgi:uncharacterized protein (UPF0262 family)
MSINQICRIQLDEQFVIRRSPEIETERRLAIADLEESNVFEPLVPLAQEAEGPFALRLMIEDDRLAFLIDDHSGASLGRFSISLKPFRRLVKEYFLVCESYFAALKSPDPDRLQAIDMGRRGLHDEGARLLKARLDKLARIDMSTARRLFTLLSILHLRPTT